MKNAIVGLLALFASAPQPRFRPLFMGVMTRFERDKLRRPNWRNSGNSKYTRHQGAKEMARRRVKP